jgi:uncharacterized protein
MITREQFFEQQPLAVFGVSRNPKKFGAAAFRELRKSGLHTFALNPHGGVCDGQTVYTALSQLPQPARAAVILTRGEGALRALKECAEQQVQWVWLQGASNTQAARALCAELGLQAFTGNCILLRTGGFPHNLHRFFHDLLFKKA